jgi:hypothetical protein
LLFNSPKCIRAHAWVAVPNRYIKTGIPQTLQITHVILISVGDK